MGRDTLQRDSKEQTKLNSQEEKHANVFVEHENNKNNHFSIYNKRIAQLP